MKIAVLGASGRTGQEFLQVALNAKHQVVAIVRTPEKIQIQHDNLEVRFFFNFGSILKDDLKDDD